VVVHRWLSMWWCTGSGLGCRCGAPVVVLVVVAVVVVAVVVAVVIASWYYCTGGLSLDDGLQFSGNFGTLQLRTAGHSE
jgi:predicted secreted protein